MDEEKISRKGFCNIEKVCGSFAGQPADEFRALVAKAQQWAEAAGMTEDDIAAAIKEVRKYATEA